MRPSSRVRAVYLRRRLNPDRPTVWIVGQDESGVLEKIELDLQAEGAPYMVPEWWTQSWGPFTKEDAEAVIAGRKAPGRLVLRQTSEGAIPSSDAQAVEFPPPRSTRTREVSVVRFFYAHAGYGYDPARETRRQGRRQHAKALAAAEQYAEAHGWEFRWSDDEDPDLSWMSEAEQREPHEVLVCVLLIDGETTDSLGGIVDPDRNYRRVIEAEMALEAIMTREPGIIIAAMMARPSRSRSRPEWPIAAMMTSRSRIMHYSGRPAELVPITIAWAKEYLYPDVNLYVFDPRCSRHGACWKRVRVTGRVKTWVRSPERIRIPVKYGLRDSFYITEVEIAAGTVALGPP